MEPSQSPQVSSPSPESDLHEETVSLPATENELSWESYVRKFGLKFSELSPAEIAMFIAARNVEQYIDGLKIPMATRSVDSGKKILVEREVEEVIEHTSYREHTRPADTPTDQMDIATVDSPAQLPSALAREWLIEDVAPDLFYQRLADRTLLRREWQETTREPHTTSETVKKKVLREEPAPPEIRKQHACVLLDISDSMADEDGRGIVSRGLALAFLKRGYEERAELKMRFFSLAPYKSVVGDSLSDLAKMAKLIIQTPTDGGTDIGAGLHAVSSDIHAGGQFARADILLITDGLSYLGNSPLGKIKLHTFILGDIFRDMDSYNKAEARKSLDTLRSWSTTFRTLKGSQFADIRTPSNEDLDAFLKYSRAIPDQIREARSEDDLIKIKERINQLSRLVKEFQEQISDAEAGKWFSSGKLGKLDQIQGVLDEVDQDLDMSGRETIITDNLQRMAREAELQKNERIRERKAQIEKRDQALSEVDQDLSDLERLISESDGSRSIASRQASQQLSRARNASENSLNAEATPPPWTGTTSLWRWLIEKAREFWGGSGEGR